MTRRSSSSLHFTIPPSGPNTANCLNILVSTSVNEQTLSSQLALQHFANRLTTCSPAERLESPEEKIDVVVASTVSTEVSALKSRIAKHTVIMLVPFFDGHGQYHLYRLGNGGVVECRDAHAVFMRGVKADQPFIFSSSPWCACLGALRIDLLRRYRRFPLLAAVAAGRWRWCRLWAGHRGW